MKVCNILNIANGKKSELHEQFLEIFEDDQAAEIAYAKAMGKDFMKRFGDWAYNYRNPTAKNLRRIGLVNARTGEPLLTKDLKNNMWFYTDKNGDRDYIDKVNLSDFSAQEIEEVTNHLLYEFVLEGGKKSYNEYDPNALEEGRIMASIDSTIANYRNNIKGRENEAVLSERIALVEANKVEFRAELISYIAALGVQVRERITDAEGNPITEIADKDKGGGVNVKESFESNSKDTATVNTKIFLSQIENRVFGEDENGNEVSLPVEDGFLETESFAKFDDVWNTLNKILVDQVGYGHGEEVRDIFDEMYDKIVDYSDTKLWMHSLLDNLKSYRDSGNTNKITEFVQAFSKTNLNYFVTQVDGGEYSVINATSTNSRQSQITNKWFNSFEALYLSDKGVLETREREILENTRQDLEKAFDDWNEGVGLAGTNIHSDEYKDAIYDESGHSAVDIVDIFEKLGVVDIDTDDIQNMVTMNGGDKKMKQTIDDLFKRMRFMLDAVLEEDFEFVSKDGVYDNIFNREASVKALAESVGFRNTDMSDSSVLLNQGKSGYAISNPTYISNKINEWKKDPSQLKNMLLDVSKKNSEWLNHLLATDVEVGEERTKVMEDRLDAFKSGLDASFKSKGKNDGVANTAITTNDQINANMVQMLNDKLAKNNKSYFPTIIAADKSRRILFEGIPSFTSNIQTNKKEGGIYVGPQAIKVASGYFLDEYNRMKRVSRESKDDDVSKVVHYHDTFNEEGEKTLGNGSRSQIFPEFDRDNTDPKFQALRNAIYGDTFESEKFEGKGLSKDQTDVLNEYIKTSIQERVAEHASVISKLDGLSEKLLEHYNKDYNALAGDYFMNGLISSVEYTKLFSGDPAYYKNNADLIKRIPATYTDGLQLRLADKDSLRFNQATVEGVEVASRYVDKILASVKDKSIAKAYNRVNTTDAQAWITPRRWRFLKQRLGQWGPQHDKVYGKMMSGETMSPEESKLAAQPLKGVYFEINEGRPVYLKYSQAVLIPSLVKGTPMEALFNKMTNNPETGKPYLDKEAHLEVHEVITIDGIKVGAVEPTRINKEGTTELLDEADIVLNPQELNNRGWKLQQDLPIKLMKETNVGSQIQKNIFEGLNMVKSYNFEGGMTGKELAQRMHDTVSKLSNLGKADLKRKYGIDENNIISDKQFIYNTLIDEFKDRGGNENIITALQKQQPFDAIPQIRGKVESIFMSIMNRKLTKITTEGGSFIQVSPFGFEKLKKDAKNGITIVSKEYNEEALLPPRIEKDKNGNDVVLPGQAMIPHSQAVKILQKHGIKITGKDLRSAMALLDPSALELITYRIPNQGMSSNDYLQIVGILPPGVGDSIIVYDGLPAKTGSDFDIDKLFAMQNHVVYDTDKMRLSKLTKENQHLVAKVTSKEKKDETPSEKLERIARDEANHTAKIDKMLTQNELVAQYKAVLNAPQTYDAMMRSIDGAQLKDDIAGTKEKGFKDGLFPAPVMKNMELFSPLTQLRTKQEYLSGKMGVGQTANHLVDHVMNQMLDVRLKTWIGVGNKREVQGKKGKKNITYFDSATTGTHSIADNLSAFLNAYVDIAKDPYIARGNHNSITANTTFMLLRAGADMKWVNRFIGQPILQELVAIQTEQQSITANDIMLKEEGGEFKASAMDSILARHGFGKIPENVTGKTVESLTESALESNIRNREVGSPMEYEILKAWSMLQEQGKIFGDAVIAAKSDTAGAGGSNIDRMVNSNKIEKIVRYDKNLDGYEAKAAGTMLGTYQENTLGWVKDVIRASNLFLSGTQAAEDTFNAISFQTANGKLLTDAKLGKAIDNSFYSYIMSGTTLFKDNNDNYLSITEDVPVEILERQAQIEAGSHPENFLISELEVQTRKDKKYLGINNKDKPTHYQNSIYRAWMELYDTHTYVDGKLKIDIIHPDRELALDLVRYAFVGSGFQNNLTQFFTHIPHQILADNNMSGEIRDAIRNINKMTTDSLFVDQFQRHNKDNHKVVKSVNVGSMEGNSYGFIYTPAKRKSQELGSVDGNKRFFPKFVNGRVSNFNPQTGWTKVDNYLFEKRGTVKREDADGEMIDVPVYTRTFELGSSEGKYKTLEYGRDQAMTSSNIESNNLSPLVALKAQDKLDDISMEASFEDNTGADINIMMQDAFDQQTASDMQTIISNLTQIIEDKKIQCK